MSYDIYPLRHSYQNTTHNNICFYKLSHSVTRSSLGHYVLFFFKMNCLVFNIVKWYYQL